MDPIEMDLRMLVMNEWKNMVQDKDIWRDFVLSRQKLYNKKKLV